MSYSIKPEEHELRKARNAVEAAVESVRHSFPVEGEVSFNLGWDGRDYTTQKMGGVSGRTVAENVITLSFNSEVEGWEETLKRTAVHEYGHVLFYNANSGLSDFMWQFLVEEALAQHLAERFFPDAHSPWNQKYSTDEISQEWGEIRHIIKEEEVDYEHPLFLGGEKFPDWMGYSVAYLIGERLLEDHDLDEFPQLKRSEVIETGDKLFD